MLAPIGAMIIQFAVSRQREFEADRVGAEILGRPMPLANALRRLDALAHQIPMQVAPAAAPLAQVNPLAAHGGGAGLFSTHPPTEERVARLEAMRRRAAKWATTAWPSGSASPAWSWRCWCSTWACSTAAHVLSFKEAVRWSRRARRPRPPVRGLPLVAGGRAHALEYYTGYLIELSLSVDNLFVFILIFQYFAVPAEPSRGCSSGASSAPS